jgi:capsular exopolysaccharide synthesis family protein
MRSDLQSEGLDFERVLYVLRRRARLILLCFVLAAGTALVLSLREQKQYSTSATLLFRDPRFAENLFGTGIPMAADPTREAATNVSLVGLRTVADLTAKKLGGPETGASVSSKVSVSAQGQSDLVSVTVTDPNPLFAARLANAFAREYIGFRRDADRRKVYGAQKLVEAQLKGLPPEQRTGPEGKTLERADKQLGLLAALQTGNAELVQSADVPGVPSSPRPVRSTVLGAIVGLLLGVGLAFLLERFNRRLRDTEELAETYALPVLGTVSQSRALAIGGDPLPPSDREMDSFRMLRARLRYFNVDHDIRTVLITSSAAQDGKTTIAWNLATAAAGGGDAKVLLVEADLRRPTLAVSHGLVHSPGLVEALTHGIALDDVIQSVPIPNRSNGQDPTSTLDVIVAGAVPPNPVELLESEKMAALLKELEANHDFVVIDTSPTSIVPDAFPLMKHVSGVIVVGRLGKSTRDEVEHLHGELQRLRAPVLGVVANAVTRTRSGQHGYYGYYGEGQAPA